MLTLTVCLVVLLAIPINEAVAVQFDPTVYTVNETDGAVVRFRIVKLASTTQPISVSFSTSPGTATDPADFIGQSDVLVTFSPDETEQYVNVSVVNDEILEGNEMFTATLTSNDSTVTNGSNNTATATIIDTDMVEIEFDPTSYTVIEDDGTVILFVHKIGENEIPVTVNITTFGDTAEDLADFIGISQTLTFAHGRDAVIQVPIPIINNNITEGTEEFFAELSCGISNDVNIRNDRADCTIFDDEDVKLTSNIRRQFACLGQEVNFICHVIGSSVLEWYSPLINRPFRYTRRSKTLVDDVRGNFTASLTEKSGLNPLNTNFTSTLRVNASRVIMRNETTVRCRSFSTNRTDTFTVGEIPTAPRDVSVNATRATDEERVNNTITWIRPQNFDQFDIHRYDINVTSTSGVLNMTTACGECTRAVITVSENPNNVQVNTTFTATIAAVNYCGENGPTATASYTLMSCGGTQVLSFWAVVFAAVSALALTQEE